MSRWLEACPEASVSSACTLLEAIHGQVVHVHGLIALHPIWTNSEIFFGLSSGDSTQDLGFPRVIWVMISCIWDDVVLGVTWAAEEIFQDDIWDLRGINLETDEFAGPENSQRAFEHLRLRKKRELWPALGFCALFSWPYGNAQINAHVQTRARQVWRIRLSLHPFQAQSQRKERQAWQDIMGNVIVSSPGLIKKPRTHLIFWLQELSLLIVFWKAGVSENPSCRNSCSNREHLLSFLVFNSILILLTIY